MNSKDQAILEIFHVWESSNLIGLENCGAQMWPKLKNQVIELLEMTESVCCFYRLYTTVYPYVKIIIIAQSSLDVFRIQYRYHNQMIGLSHFYIILGMSEHAHLKWMNKFSNLNRCLATCKKFIFQMKLKNYLESLWAFLNIPDHIQLI